jgi:hypothetical protein
VNISLGRDSINGNDFSIDSTKQSARVIINAIDAVCEYFDHPTPVHVFRFMAHDKFREKILAATENPLLQMFKEQYDEKLRDSEQMSKFSPPINKVGKLLRPSIIPIIGQPKSLDFLDIMNTKKIVVCRFSKGRLGEEIAQILGSLIVSMVSISALKREKQRARPPFMLVADEVHNFVPGGRFGTLLAESRKYGITLVLASQGTECDSTRLLLYCFLRPRYSSVLSNRSVCIRRRTVATLNAIYVSSSCPSGKRFAVRAMARLGRRLENKLQRQLADARIVNARYIAEHPRAVGVVSIDRKELCVVEDVEEFSAKLQRFAFCELQVLQE